MHLVSLVVFLCSMFRVNARTIPSYVKLCKRTDPELSKCLVSSVEHLRPYLLKGIPEFRIPSYDPLEIPQVGLDQGSEPLSFKAKFNDLRISGARDVQVRHVGVDLDQLKLELQLFFPKLRVQSKYKLDGFVLVLPVQGDGQCVGNLTDVNIHVVLNGKSETRKGLTYISLKDRKVNLNMKDTTVYFENLFKGNKHLGDATNLFFNENWRDILNEIRPVLEETIAEVLLEIVHSVFDLFPLEHLLPE